MSEFDELIVLAIEARDLGILRTLVDKIEDINESLDHGRLLMKLEHRVDWESMDSEFLGSVLREVDNLFRLTGGYNDEDDEYSGWVQFGVWECLFEKITSVDINGDNCAYVIERMGIEHRPEEVIENVISAGFYVLDDVDAIIQNIYKPLTSFENVSIEYVNNELFKATFRTKFVGEEDRHKVCIQAVLKLIEKYNVDFSNVALFALKTALHVESSELVYALIENGVSLSLLKTIREVGEAEQWRWLDQVELVREVEQLVPIFEIFDRAGVEDVTVYRHLYKNKKCVREACHGLATSIEDLERTFNSPESPSSTERL